MAPLCKHSQAAASCSQRAIAQVPKSVLSALPCLASARCSAVPSTSSSRGSVIARATSGDVEVKEPEVKEVTIGLRAAAPVDDVWVPVCLPEELPKGVRKEVEVEGRPVLLFWYRNQIYAIEGRSPAEGAYSEGFIAAKFTQDYCIECPATGSLFSIKDGSIQSWYPNNPVLRALTPQSTCRPMDIFPVKLTQQAICVDISRSSLVATRADRGGAGTSLENNNVFTVQPNVYFEGMDPSVEQASVYQDKGPAGAEPGKTETAAIAAVSVLAFGGAAVVGTAVIIYLLGTQ